MALLFMVSPHKSRSLYHHHHHLHSPITASRTRRRFASLSFNPLYRSNPLATAVFMAPPTASDVRSAAVRSSLIEPDGGKLVELVVPPDQRAERRVEAAAMPAVKIGRVDLEWVQVVAEGWASPLRGFMREDEYLQSLHFNSLRLPAQGSVVNMSLPIVLAITDDDKEAIGVSPDVALAGPDGNAIAILRSFELEPVDQQMCCS